MEHNLNQAMQDFICWECGLGCDSAAELLEHRALHAMVSREDGRPLDLQNKFVSDLASNLLALLEKTATCPQCENQTFTETIDLTSSPHERKFIQQDDPVAVVSELQGSNTDYVCSKYGVEPDSGGPELLEDHALSVSVSTGDDGQLDLHQDATHDLEGDYLLESSLSGEESNLCDSKEEIITLDDPVTYIILDESSTSSSEVETNPNINLPKKQEDVMPNSLAAMSLVDYVLQPSTSRNGHLNLQFPNLDDFTDKDNLFGQTSGKSTAAQIPPKSYCSPVAMDEGAALLTEKKEKKYGCSHCSLQFAWFVDRRRHILMTHTGEQPYQCHICGITYTRYFLLRKHMLTCSTKPTEKQSHTEEREGAS